MFLFDGLPAIREIVDCSNPAGSCPGKIGGLEVVNGSTIYAVFTSGFDQQATERVLASFHISKPQGSPGCSFTVDRRGFNEFCHHTLTS